MTVEEKLKDMGLSIPEPPSAAGNYVPAVRTGNLVFLSGVAPRLPDGSMMVGKVGRELTTEQGWEAARLCALSLLANLKGTIDDLDNVRRIVKVLGLVNSDPEFGEQPKVINGCSDLLVDVFAGFDNVLDPWVYVLTFLPYYLVAGSVVFNADG